ncbi:MAG: hypothetical protein K4304_07385 [Propionicimonas sp.]|jgi:hypothetical protein
MRLVDASEPWNALPNVDPTEVVIATNRNELAGLANCIGEALNAIDDWEFDTRVGLLPEEARRLRDAISQTLRTVSGPQ